MRTFEPYRRALIGSVPIFLRHILLLVNAIIFSVVALLFVFGDIEAAIFLGIIITFNILLGVAQDFRARVALEKLQLLTALHVMRMNEDGTEEQVFIEDIKKGDRIKVKLGDEIPCDGVLITAEGFEVSEALITGESDAFPRAGGEQVLAGSIVASGVATIRAETIFAESRIAQMSNDVKKYAASPSPIESAINRIIKYSGYVLVLTLMYVFVHGYLTHEPILLMVKNAGALAGVIVPQGLVVVTTLLFAFGAASYSRQQVLFQEINATEKLGRIKNLCMDKTGTLTDNRLAVEHMYVIPGSSTREASEFMSAYLAGSGDSSETVNAVAEFLGRTYSGDFVEALPFSSWRQYGAVLMKANHPGTALFVGAPDIFLHHIRNTEERTWLEQLIAVHSQNGRRVLCLLRSKEAKLPEALSDAQLSPVAAFVLKSTLREGIGEAIRFFQERGVRIRILTGDNPKTACAVALATGITDADKIITGTEMASWSPGDYVEKTKRYTIFARVVPEQKVKIIEALKRDGFTAMVGDGANDALAIKRADLGIAMFDGAPATRQLAAVVLMNNSFTALPGGVRLADNFIRNIEIFTSIFLQGSFLGFFLFIIMSALGHVYPLTPLNITLMNYFSVGLPGILISYWAIRPMDDTPPVSTEQFLKRILPFPVFGAVIGSGALAAAFIFSPNYLQTAQSNTVVIIAYILFSFLFFMLAPRMYNSALGAGERLQLLVLAIFEVVLFFFALRTPLFVYFFNLTPTLPSSMSIALTVVVVFVFTALIFPLRVLLLKKD